MHPRSRRLLIVAIIVLQIMALFAILWNNQRGTETVLREHAFEVLEKLIEDVADRTRSYLLPAEQMAALTRELVGNGILDPYDDVQLETYFLSKLHTTERLSSAYLGRDDGSFILVRRLPSDTAATTRYLTRIIRTHPRREVIHTTRDSHLQLLERRVIRGDDYDPRVRVWYPAAYERTRPVWSEPYIFYTLQQPGITSAVGVQDSAGTTVGVVGMDIELSALSSFIRTIPIGSSGSTLIYNQDYRIIAGEMFGKATEDVHNTLPSVWDAAPAYIKLLLKSAPQQGDTEKGSPHDFADHGELHYGMYGAFAIDDWSDTRWYIAAEAPAQDFVGVVQNNYRWGITNIIIIGMLSLLGTGILLLGMDRPMRALYDRATRDQLTQLLNRDEFVRQAERVQKHISRFGGHAAIAVLDLDGFKPVNDRYGHAIGDEVLQIFANRLQANVKRGDIVGRLGGDEFALVLRHVAERDAHEAVERVRRCTTKELVISSRGEHTIGATAGVISLYGRLSIVQLLDIADAALIAGKVSEKGRTYRSSYHPKTRYIQRLLRQYGREDKHSIKAGRGMVSAPGKRDRGE